METEETEYWTITDTKNGAIIRPKDDVIKCSNCGETMILHAFSVRKFEGKDAYHCDVQYKCPHCSHVTVFGVAVSKEDYERLKNSKLHRKVLRDELLEDGFGLTAEEQTIIERRLKTLEYW